MAFPLTYRGLQMADRSIPGSTTASLRRKLNGVKTMSLETLWINVSYVGTYKRFEKLASHLINRDRDHGSGIVDMINKQQRISSKSVKVKDGTNIATNQRCFTFHGVFHRDSCWPHLGFVFERILLLGSMDGSSFGSSSPSPIGVKANGFDSS